VASAVAHAETAHDLFDGRLTVTLPETYELYADGGDDGRAEFRARGGHAALSKKFPVHPYDPQFLDRFLHEDIRANVVILTEQLLPTNGQAGWEKAEGGILMPSEVSAEDLHRHYCEGFAKYYDHETTFAHFDPKTEIGRCVNIAGAFVAIYTRRVGDTLVIVGAMDFVEVLIVEKKGPGKAVLDMTDAEKWEVYRAAANADVAEQVLLSAEVR